MATEINGYPETKNKYLATVNKEQQKKITTINFQRVYKYLKWRYNATEILLVTLKREIIT